MILSNSSRVPIRLLILILSFTLCSCDVEKRAVVRIDIDKTYQTIDGFGGFGAKKVWWAEEPFFDESFIHTLTDDLGVSIIRDEIPLGFEWRNDNQDPHSFDYDTNDLNFKPEEAHTHVRNHLDYLRALNDQGMEKIILSVWSPPLWMKHNQSRGNDLGRGNNSAPAYVEAPEDKSPNQLRREYFEEFAEYCAAYIKLVEREAGVSVYAVSLQNEPAFSQWYPSAVYSPDALASLIAIVGSYFKKHDIETKIFGPEDVASYNRISAYLNAIFENEKANQYLDIIAIHGYKNDGVSPSNSGPTYWKKTWELADEHGKRLWMTETSGPSGDVYAEALQYATSIYNGLHYGNVNAWVFWQMSGGGEKTLIRDGQPSWLFYVSKHFYKHIAPGALRTRADSNNRSILALNFLSEDRSQQTTVLLNISENLVITELDKGVEDRQCWQTQNSMPYAEIPCTASVGISLPAMSITTVVSQI